MPSQSEISERIAHESDRRRRLSVPAFACGFLYLLSGIIISETLKGAPTVGLLQGIGPALSGVANPAVSPRAAEVKFISHHSLPLIAGSVIAGIAIGGLTLILLLLVDATRWRRPESWRAARPLVLFGGVAVALVSVAHQVLSALLTHHFVVGHDFSGHAVELALTKGTANELSDYLDLLAGFALAAGMIVTMLGAMRVGLLVRWAGVLGIFTGVLIFLPIGGATLEIVPAFWMVVMGMLYAERWPGGDPPAWSTGEARPWPSRADQRAAQEGGGGEALAGAGAGGGNAPVLPGANLSGANSSSGKRKRRRGARSGEGQRPE
jgi:MFS family permease